MLSGSRQRQRTDILEAPLISKHGTLLGRKFNVTGKFMFRAKGIYFATALALTAFSPVDAAVPSCSSSDVQCLTGVTPGSTQTSVTRTVVAGIGPQRESPSRISVNIGKYRVNGGKFTSVAGTVANGDEVTLRVVASDSHSTAVTQMLSIEGQPNRTFRVITSADNPGSQVPPPPPPVIVPEPVPVRWSEYGKLTLPVDHDGRRGVDEIEADDLDGYSSIYWYQPSSGQLTQAGHVATTGETVFWTPVNGNGITPSSSFPRTEMREKLTVGEYRPNWKLTGTHIQKATVAITKLPTAISAKTRTFLVFGQIHSDDNVPPMKMIFQRLSDGTTEIMSNYNTKRQSGFSKNSPVRVSIGLGEKFNYEIRVIDGTVTTLVNDIVLDVRDMSATWAGEEMFFKAGSYIGNNLETATGYGEVVYSNFEVVHQ